MTVNEVLDELRQLTKREIAHEITSEQATEEMNEILMKARVSMTDQELLEIQRAALIAHQMLADNLSEQHGISVTGNDPTKPN